MSEIEILLQEINAINQQSNYYMILAIIGFAITIASVFLLIDRHKKLGVGVIILGFAIIGISFASLFFISEEQHNLSKQLENFVEDEFKAKSCDGMRIAILNIMDDRETPKYYSKKLDFFKDYYYHKCEIPLREEVLKLQ